MQMRCRETKIVLILTKIYALFDKVRFKGKFYAIFIL